MKSELEEFRTRWFRWLGQKTRVDKFNWVTLLDCNWTSWAQKILEDHNIDIKHLSISSLRDEVKNSFYRAIECADMKELRQLDNLYCIELIEKMGW